MALPQEGSSNVRDRIIRSILFVPADNDRKLAKSIELEADAIAFDLEDSVLPANKPLARIKLGEFFKTNTCRSEHWVRVNDVRSGELLKDLAAVVPMQPVGIVLPKICGPEDIDVVGHWLEMAEAMTGVTVGQTKIIAVATETPEAVLRLSELGDKPRPRLRGLIWGAEDLSSAMGAGDPRNKDGSWRFLYQQVRGQMLLAAHMLDVQAIDTVYVDFRDSDGCLASARESRHDGFTGKVAIHPGQLEVINEAFTASEAEVLYAKRVLEAFEKGEGAVSLDGKMLDIPHLKAAQRVLDSVGVR
ncbi:citrate lyase subunit beta / citryl-CoA lyase [Marinobacter sp. es.048]|uniref:HpcH/HpaI aldolase/citrate lyase family protein n=1 Tax=Marinobacter sp. es.048 TaxID=1761795 RepID=UPI000B5890A8|nr:CoA ester lyase [Marinobacter sp. es.048]SNC62683.1 citrate lyase subunit beta / citryl-CoA lyase [Marinobacter sp. es.048]